MAEKPGYPFAVVVLLKTPLGFLRIEPPILVLYAQAPELLQTDPILLNNYIFGLNFVFQIPKLVYFISFAYEPKFSDSNCKMLIGIFSI
jgi:hypothetical protein